MTEPKIPIKSLAGQALGDETATDRERRVAGAFLRQVREDQEAEAQATPAAEPTPLEELELRKAELERKLAARRGRPGSAENVRDIETALAEINAEIDRKRSSDPEVA
ncbi:MAG: hypothetical protein IT508_11005 [Burkholderiaceae bacterium]|nr:hypothetical protein [Burkholderiaceae bacterium]